VEKKVKNALRAKGVEGYANDKFKNYTETLDAGAEAISKKLDSSKAGEKFLEGAVKIISDSESQIRKLKRPDLHSEKPVTRRRVFLVNGFKK